MRKKVVSVMLATALGACLLAGCGSSSSSADSDTGTSAAEETSSEEESVLDTSEVADLVVEVITTSEMTGITEVEDAINEITESAIGVHVSLYPVSIFDMDSTNMLAVSSGEQLDLMRTASFTGGTGQYISSGACLALDDYINTYGADLEELFGTALLSGYSGGSLYSIPTDVSYGGGYAFYARQDILDECGITIDEDKVYTMDELTEIFATVKEAYPDMYMVAGNHSSSDDIEFTALYDTLGASTSSGVLMNLGLNGETEVVNLYETDEFAEYAQVRYEWAQAGYIPSDAATNTDDGGTQIATGNYLGIFNLDECASTYTASTGYEMVQLLTVEPAGSTQKLASGS